MFIYESVVKMTNCLVSVKPMREPEEGKEYVQPLCGIRVKGPYSPLLVSRTGLATKSTGRPSQSCSVGESQSRKEKYFYPCCYFLAFSFFRFVTRVLPIRRHVGRAPRVRVRT